MFDLLLMIAIVGLAVKGLYAYEQYKWNDGICKQTGNPWELSLHKNGIRWYFSAWIFNGVKAKIGKNCFITFTSIDNK